MSEEKELRNGWIIQKLGDVCFTTSGGTPSRKVPSYYQGNIPWVKSGELDKGLITKTEEYISEEAVKNSSAKIFPKGTLLIALYGATIGKLGFLGIDAATNQAVCGIFKNEFIDLQFLKYYLFNKRNKLIEQGAGGAQPNISQTILKDLDVVIPPLPEQHRIVAKIEELFSSLDKGIESLKTAQQQLKVYRQAVLKHAFEGKLTVKWRQQQEMGARLPAGRFEGRFTNKDIKEGKLPEGWVWKTIEDVCNMKAGFFVKASDIKENFEDGLFPCYGGNGLRGYVKSITHDGTFVLVGRQGALCGNVHLVKGKFHATEHALVTKAKENVDIQWLYYKLISMKLNQYSSGVAQPGLSVNKLLPIELSVPTLPEQHHIVSEIEKRLSVADKLEESIATALQQAEALRQSILKKAFEGRLLSEAELNECRKDPNWEPASVLLERIKKERETQTNSVKKKSVKTKKSTKSKNLNQSKNE